MSDDPVENVLVIGAGAMGESIAQQFAQAGIMVALVDIDGGTLQRASGQIRSNVEQLKRFGLVPMSADEVLARIEFKRVAAVEDVLQVSDRFQFAIEVVPEKLELKQGIFEILDRFEESCVLASNTSTLSITEISGLMNSAHRVVGVHFFYPAHIIPLVEIHAGERTDRETVDRAEALMHRIGKKPVRIRKVLPGFIVNRMQAAFNREVIHMLEEGVATAEELDMAARACFGFRLACLGPLEIHDLNGLDVVLNSWKQTRPSLCNTTEPSASVLEKVERGELGVKSGRGWYDYRDKPREQVLFESNEKLLRQLKLFFINI